MITIHMRRHEAVRVLDWPGAEREFRRGLHEYRNGEWHYIHYEPGTAQCVWETESNPMEVGLPNEPMEGDRCFILPVIHGTDHYIWEAMANPREVP